jgi:hypothetical protein
MFYFLLLRFSGSGQPSPGANVPADAADEALHPEQSPGGAHHAASEPPAGLRATPGSGCHEVRRYIYITCSEFCLITSCTLGSSSKLG